MALSAAELKGALAAMDGAAPSESSEATGEALVATEQSPDVPRETVQESQPGTAAPATPKPQETKTPDPEDGATQRERFSKQWATAQRMAKEAEQLKAQIESEKAELQRQRGEIESLRKMMSDDPAGFVEKNGGADFIKKLTQVYTGKGLDPAEEVVALRKELQSIRDEVKGTFEKQSQAEKEKETIALVNNYRREVETTINTKEDYDLVAAMGQHEEAIQLATIYAGQYNKVLTADEAASKIQEELRQEYLPKIAKTRSLQEHYRSHPDEFKALAEKLGYSLGNAKKRGEVEGKPRNNDTSLSQAMAGDAPVGLGDDEVYDRKTEVRRAMALLA